MEKVAKCVELGLVGDPLQRVCGPAPEFGAHGAVAPHDQGEPQFVGEHADGGRLPDAGGAAEDQQPWRVRPPRPRPRRGPR